ncbi:WD repeat-containing protein 76 isoform X2 [Jatropha curcas]|uniref:WD repeat-containing protein 76 isoform X2 n=1 Tax=Jatropha curcas TaxID=180498 RepID=UPI0005FB69C6|nr:WD repeat-containing protein 76 isoform X2 [Jatropha curcas]
MAPQKLTEYERKRLENIRRNDEMMAALKIHSKASQLSAATKRQRIGPSKSHKLSPEKKKNTQTESPMVIRRSLRARGMPPDSGGLDMDSIETPIKIPTPISSPKPSPRVMGPLSMRDAYSGTGSDRELTGTILSLEKKTNVDSSIKKESDGFEAVKKEENGDFSHELVEGVIKSEYFDSEIKIEKKEIQSCVDLWSMDLKPENIARILPGRIMIVRFWPCTDVNMIVAGNKFGNIAFWNVDSKGKEEGDGIFLYRPHTAPVSGILFQKSCPKIFTSSYDGFLRLMDAEKDVFDLVYSSDDAIFSLSQRPNDMNGLYFGEGHGGLNIWDERTGKSSSHWILHEDRINSIDFNSQNPNIMATSSTDGTACLWDLRRVNADKPENLKIISHNRAVHSAYFSPSGSFLATTRWC